MTRPGGNLQSQPAAIVERETQGESEQNDEVESLKSFNTARYFQSSENKHK